MTDDLNPAAEPSIASDSGQLIVPSPHAARRAKWAERFFILCLTAFALLAVLASRYAYFEWDFALARDIQSISLPGFDSTMLAVSFLGDGLVPWVLVVATGAALIIGRLRIEGTLLATFAGAGWLVNRLWKLLIARPRPSEALVHIAGAYRQESFPSGHVTFFVEFFGFLFFLAYVLLKRGTMKRVTLIVLGALIVVVGVSRVYLGAHWPSDVIGAYLAGGIWLMLVIEVYRRIKGRKDV